MRKLQALIITILLLFIPVTLAYWESNALPETEAKSNIINIGKYQYDVPAGSFEWFEKNYFKNGDIVLSDGKYFQVVDDSKCWNTSCPKPSDAKDGYNNPYRSLSLDWIKSIFYKKDNVVMYGGKLYIAYDVSDIPSTPPTQAFWKSWKPLDSIEFTGAHYREKGTYVLYDKAIYLLGSEIYGDQIGFNPNRWGDVKFDKPYAITHGAYKEKDAVFHKDGIYHVQDVTLANKSKPGEVYGAWQRIDNSNWYATNVYKKGDIVRHDNKVYKAHVDGVRAEPGTQTYSWVLISDVFYNEFSVYQKNDVVIHGNVVYYATEETSGIEPKAGVRQWIRH